MELNQNFPHIINSSFLSFYSINIVLTSHVICHVTFSLKKFNNWQIGGEFKKKASITFFSFMLINSKTSRLKWLYIAIQWKPMRVNIILKAQI